MSTQASSRRKIIHVIVQVALLASAAVNVFLAAVVISRALWLALVFLVAAAAVVLGVLLEKLTWLGAAAVISIVASVLAINMDAAVDHAQPIITGVFSVILLTGWWLTRPRFIRGYPDDEMQLKR